MPVFLKFPISYAASKSNALFSGYAVMSSNDAVSMVFKCMLKGAADFLVKPIRKNELRNLWQHVWRKQLVRLRACIASF